MGHVFASNIEIILQYILLVKSSTGVLVINVLTRPLKSSHPFTL